MIHLLQKVGRFITAYSEEGTYHITASDIKTEEVFATLVVVITNENQMCWLKITKEGE